MEDSQKKKKYSWIWTLLFILMNVGVLVWTGLSELERKKTSGVGIRDIQIRWPFLVLTALCFLTTVLAETGKYYSLIKRLTEKKRPGTALAVTIYGRYYDNITPSGAGGQPFQIHYLKKKGLPDGASLAIPVYAFLLQQLTFVFSAGLVFLFLSHYFDVPAIRVTAHIGLFFYSLVPLGIIFSALFPRAMWKVIMLFLRGLSALHLVKDPEAKGDRIIRQLTEYSQAINYINKHRRLSLEMIFLSLLYHIARTSLPYFILAAFGAQTDYLTTTVATFYIYAAISIIPTPGGSGAAEASFYLVFSGLPEAGLVFWAMLTWRFFSDYIFIGSGILLTFFDYLHDRILARRAARREAQEKKEKK